MTDTAGLRITDVQVTTIEGNFYWLIVRIDTNAGIYGYGESFGWPNHHIIKQAILDRKPLLVGEDPTEVVPLVEQMSLTPFDDIGGKAISGLEMALWDITGKVLGVPVYKLLGGRHRDEVRIYCDCHAGVPISALGDYYREPKNYTPDAYAAHAGKVKQLGFSLLKFDLFRLPEPLVPKHSGLYSSQYINYCSEIVSSVRTELGWDVDVAIDFNGLYTTNAIRLLDQLEEYRLAWAEDVIAYQGVNVAAMAEVTRAVTTPTLTGESLCSVESFRPLLETQAIRIVAPDLAVVGGIHEMIRVAQLADLHHILVAPHNICSPVGTMAAVHTCAAITNFVGLEYHAVGVSWWQDVILHDNDIINERGHIRVPDSPGLGVELNEDVVREHLADGENYFE